MATTTLLSDPSSRPSSGVSLGDEVSFGRVFAQDIGVTYLMIPIITVGLTYQQSLGSRSRPA